MKGVLLLTTVLLLQAETHRFQPTQHFREFSPYVEPVLRIRPGDVVITTSVDSEGNDETGTHVTSPWNPLTGPFFIETAEPGDTLVVALEEIRLNRNTGIQSTGMADTTVLPAYLLKTRTSFPLITWRFNTDSMIGTTDFSERMKKFRLPLRPFLGCIGVAPALREAQSSITADTHGGNMDYNELVEGTTVYLPVHVAGAYLYIGDGHAAQGHGETSGGGIETSMHVRFRVSLQKQKIIPSVRAESNHHLMAMGMARPLDEAFQRATVNMIDWLTRDFGLSPEEAHVLLGSTADYDIANMRNPRYTVVCKVDKAVIRQLVDGEP